MRILLTANASYVPPRGGATRSNLVWLESLAARGHNCRVVAALLANDTEGRQRQMESEGISAVPLGATRSGINAARLGAIEVYSAADPARRTELLREQIREFAPDWILVSSEDLGQVLLREAVAGGPDRTIYLAHTPQLFPFGPASWNVDERGTELVRRCAAVVAIGQHTAGYIREHAGREAHVVHPPLYGSGPFEELGSFDKGWIAMINPCAVKGIAIFTALARAFPAETFAAVVGWGTTSADRAELESLPNVKLLENVKRIEQVFENTRVFLMPSLWYEGFGLSVMEAMLHGIPVLASDSGGLLEAKMGTRYILPVRPIVRYRPVFDEHGLPEAEVLPQDTAAWEQALREILSNRALYEEESRISRERALAFVASVRPEQMEELLTSLPRIEPQAGGGEALSPEKRALLLQRLRKKTGSGGG